MPLHGENQTGAMSVTIREMSRPAILSRFPLNRSAFPAFSFLNQNTPFRSTWICTVRFLGAHRSLGVSLPVSHHTFAIWFLMGLARHIFGRYLTSCSYFTKNWQQSLISHFHTAYILSTHYIHGATHGNMKNSVKFNFWKHTGELTLRDAQTAHFTLFDVQKKVYTTLLFEFTFVQY